jgi:hypothetical protein
MEARENDHEYGHEYRHEYGHECENGHAPDHKGQRHGNVTRRQDRRALVLAYLA